MGNSPITKEIHPRLHNFCARSASSAFLSVLSDHQGHTKSAVCQPPALPNGWQTASLSTGYQWWVKEEQEMVSHLILNLSWPHSSSRLKCSSLETQVYLFCPPMSCFYYFPLCLVHTCLHQSFLFSGINMKSPLHCLRTHALKHDFWSSNNPLIEKSHTV